MWIVNHLYTIVCPVGSHDLVRIHNARVMPRIRLTENSQIQNRLHSSTEMLVLAVLPSWPCDGEVQNEACRIVPTTKVTFLSRRYKIVFSLDVSPSAVSVNKHDSCLIMEEIISTLRKCLCGLLRPFKVCRVMGIAPYCQSQMTFLLTTEVYICAQVFNASKYFAHIHTLA